ncbi:MAG: helix-turn-helix domain-containing protein [Gammaproteobacteria bacterium]
MDWSRIAAKLNAELARQRLSAQALARRAGVDRKTVDRLRAGHGVRQATLTWIEQALGVPLATAAATAEDAAAPVRLAALDYGGYSYALVQPLLGDYLCYRRSFDVIGRLVASHLEVLWDEEHAHLRFVDLQRNRARGGTRHEYRFTGDVLVPSGVGVLHFVVRSNDGRLRAMTTTLPRERHGVFEAKGFLLTLNEIADIGFYPVTTPVLLERVAAADVAGRIGVMESGHADYARVAAALAAIEAKFTPWTSSEPPPAS